MDERNNRNSDSTYFRIYILVLGVYAAIRIVFALLAKIPALHTVSELSDRWSFFQFFKWIYQVYFFGYSQLCVTVLQNVLFGFFLKKYFLI